MAGTRSQTSVPAGKTLNYQLKIKSCADVTQRNTGVHGETQSFFTLCPQKPLWNPVKSLWNSV